MTYTTTFKNQTCHSFSQQPKDEWISISQPITAISLKSLHIYLLDFHKKLPVFSSSILYLATVHNFSGRLLHLLQLRNEVPESGLGDDMVRSEDPHAVQRRGRAFRRGQAAPDHLVLPQLEGHEKQAARRVSDTESGTTAAPAPRRTRAPQRNNATRRAQSRSRESP